MNMFLNAGKHSKSWHLTSLCLSGDEFAFLMFLVCQVCQKGTAESNTSPDHIKKTLKLLKKKSQKHSE